jgi:hypothetical protein
MTAVLCYFPYTLLQESKMQWEIMGNVVGSGQTGSGAMPLSRLDGGGLWKATLTELGLWTADHRRTWRAVSAIADGGAQPLIVTVRENVDAPWPIVSGSEVSSFAPVPHSDGSFFSDGSGYATSAIEAIASGAVDLRSTEMTIEIVAGGELKGGEYFSIDHEDLRWRLYRIRTAVDNGDGTFDVTFRPPLRAVIADAQPLEFDRPKCVMRIATSDSMDATLEDGFFGKPSVSFIEAFPPFPV